VERYGWSITWCSIFDVCRLDRLSIVLTGAADQPRDPGDTPESGIPPRSGLLTNTVARIASWGSVSAGTYFLPAPCFELQEAHHVWSDMNMKLMSVLAASALGFHKSQQVDSTQGW